MELTDLSLDLMRPGSVASIQLGSFIWDLSLSEMSQDRGVPLPLVAGSLLGHRRPAGEEPSSFLSQRGPL